MAKTKEKTTTTQLAAKKPSIDILKDKEPQAVSQNNIQVLTRQIDYARSLQADIKNLQEALRAKEEALRKLETEQIPELMEELRLREFKLTDGTEITIKPVITANIPTQNAIQMKDNPSEAAALQQRRDEAFKWLLQHKAESLIKNEIDIKLGKGSEKLLQRIMAGLDKLNVPYSVEEKVHPQTLTSYIKEQLKAGIKVPLEVFNVYLGKKAYFKIPKSE